jgi:hypothetical protein
MQWHTTDVAHGMKTQVFCMGIISQAVSLVSPWKFVLELENIVAPDGEIIEQYLWS